MNAAKMIDSVSTELIEQNCTKQFDVPLAFSVATLSDCESVCFLVNSSYRGESSRQGWTNEHVLLEGQRVDTQMLTDIIEDDTCVILVFFDRSEKTLIGCVHLQNNPALKTAYLGMLTVRPDLQERGYGKFILSVAENFAVSNWNAEYIEMTVIIQRSELIAYYKRRGYVDTSQREPFATHDVRFGLPKRSDLEFCVLKKCVKTAVEKRSRST